VSIVRSNLAPITLQHPEFLNELKETAVLLAFQPSGPEKPKYSVLQKMNSSSLATPLFSALGHSLGLEEPKICKILKYLLFCHTKCFQQQMCDDPFDQIFQLEKLKHPEAATNIDQTKEAPSKEIPPYPEQSILNLMEFMALSRTEAIVLLSQYDGSVDEICATLLG